MAKKLEEKIFLETRVPREDLEKIRKQLKDRDGCIFKLTGNTLLIRCEIMELLDLGSARTPALLTPCGKYKSKKITGALSLYFSLASSEARDVECESSDDCYNEVIRYFLQKEVLSKNSGKFDRLSKNLIHYCGKCCHKKQPYSRQRVKLYPQSNYWDTIQSLIYQI